MRLVALHAVPTALRIKDIERISGQDPELQSVRNYLIAGKWDSAPKSYLPVRNELTFIGHVILRGTRIVDPKICARELLVWRTKGTKELLRQRKDLERSCGGLEWTVTQRDAWSVTAAS